MSSECSTIKQFHDYELHQVIPGTDLRKKRGRGMMAPYEAQKSTIINNRQAVLMEPHCASNFARLIFVHL